MSFVKKIHPSPVSPGPGGVPPGGSFGAMFPAIWEYLALLAYDDGTPRQGSTLLVMFEDGMVKACLTDRANERQVWVSSDDLEALALGLEDQLVGGTAQWRRKPPFVPGQRKKG